MDYSEFEARIDENLRHPEDPNFGKNLMAMFSTGNVTMDLCCQIKLMEQSIIRASIGEDLLTDESRLRALAQRGQIMGVRQVLQLVHKYIADEHEARKDKEKGNEEFSAEHDRAP